MGDFSENPMLGEVEQRRQVIGTPRESNESKKLIEEELIVRSRALAERVKELKCLHSISSLFDDRRTDLGEIFQKIVEVIPDAWQYPDLACARIVLKSRKYETPNFGDPRWRQHVDIIVGNEPVGFIEVGYTERLPDQQEPQFLPEEEILLATVARRLTETLALKETQHQLSTYQEHLRSLASELTLAEERERRKLALCLHDNIGQGLAVAKLKLETLGYLLPQEHQNRVHDVLLLIKQIIADTRSITFDISPPILYELGFKQAVLWLSDHFRKQFGLNVAVQCNEQDIALSEGVRVMLFRSIQELLANVVKHAQASVVNIILKTDGKEVQATVEDNGVGFDVDAQSYYPSVVGGFGLFSIRERIAHLGGRVVIQSNPGNGTQIKLCVPGSRFGNNT